MDKIGICNLALGLVGGSPIMSFSDETTEAIQCSQFYDAAREFCLEHRAWTFASGFRKLARAVDVSPSEFAHSYPLPPDCLVVRAVSDSEDMLSTITYQVEGSSIITDAGDVYIRYTKNTEATSTFSASFQTALAHKLAEFISSSITGDKVLKRALMEEADNAIDAGGAIDGMQGSPKRAFASRLLKARYGSGSNYGLTGLGW